MEKNPVLRILHIYLVENVENYMPWIDEKYT